MGPRPGSSLYEESFDLSSSISKKNSEVKKIKAFKACGSGCPGRKKVKKMTHMALKLFCYHPPVCCRLTPQQPVKPQANTESLQRRQEWHGFCYVYMAAVILQIVAAHSVAWARFASRGTLYVWHATDKASFPRCGRIMDRSSRTLIRWSGSHRTEREKDPQ
jgi:hypothetical protein